MSNNDAFFNQPVPTLQDVVTAPGYQQLGPAGQAQARRTWFDTYRAPVLALNGQDPGKAYAAMQPAITDAANLAVYGSTGNTPRALEVRASKDMQDLSPRMQGLRDDWLSSGGVGDFAQFARKRQIHDALVRVQANPPPGLLDRAENAAKQSFTGFLSRFVRTQLDDDGHIRPSTLVSPGAALLAALVPPEQAQDTAVNLVQGANSLANMLTWVGKKQADIATLPVRLLAPGLLDPVDKGYALVAEGFDRNQASLEQLKSPELQQAGRDVDEARGVTDTLAALAAHPSYVQGMIVQQLPQLGLVGKAMLAARGGATAAQALGRMALANVGVNTVLGAADAGTSAQQQARQNGRSDAEAEQAGNVAGLVAAPISAVASTLGGGVEARFLNHMVAGEAANLTRGQLARQIAGTLLKEAGEEGLDEGGGQFAQNVGARITYAPDQDLTSGVGKAATLGGTLGAVMGGTINTADAVQHAWQSRTAAMQTAAQTVQLAGALAETRGQALQAQIDPDTGISRPLSADQIGMAMQAQRGLNAVRDALDNHADEALMAHDVEQRADAPAAANQPAASPARPHPSVGPVDDVASLPDPRGRQLPPAGQEGVAADRGDAVAARRQLASDEQAAQQEAPRIDPPASQSGRQFDPATADTGAQRGTVHDVLDAAAPLIRAEHTDGRTHIAAADLQQDSGNELPANSPLAGRPMHPLTASNAAEQVQVPAWAAAEADARTSTKADPHLAGLAAQETPLLNPAAAPDSDLQASHSTTTRTAGINERTQLNRDTQQIGNAILAAPVLQRTLDHALAGWRNGTLRVVQSTEQAHTLLQNTDAVPLGGQGTASAHTTAQSQGYYLPASGDIILIADHLPSAEHAVWAAAHELGQRHADRTTLPAAARELRNLALVARQNGSVNALASAIARQHGLDDSLPSQRQQAAEAALAELAATRHSGDWHALQQRYGVRVPLARRDGALGVQARFADKLRDWFGRYAGMRQNEGAQVSAVLAGMLAGGDGGRTERGVGDVGLVGAKESAQKVPAPNSTTLLGAATRRGSYATGEIPQVTEHLFTRDRTSVPSMENALNFADERGAFNENLVDYRVLDSRRVLVDHGGGMMVQYNAVPDSIFAELYGGNKLAAYGKNLQFFDNERIGWQQMFGGNSVVSIPESTLLSSRGTVAAFAHEYTEMQDLWNALSRGKMTPPKIQGLIDNAHFGAVKKVDRLIGHLIISGGM
ncbi:hypothetical protein SAMN02745857_02745 [Andreprevotia lacus DSM 23236]|uniref:Uncharacterized protein n=1 Tax=Andreprevotia lacus DSM 23236 TaxID=1121001 RepID=A0A1W1XT86_9NEIS|nr:hypothetical protein [Andreprevotia lacus]SMC27190.1 hypothetical protein SAMN02745857_02745 [Andreprevotia lacus DSM 23236]